MARVPSRQVSSVVDLGCGTGNALGPLRSRWPDATYVGVDNSEAMLRRAAADNPDARWVNADIAEWRPADTIDLIFSNAALHWLGDHTGLFPNLLSNLTPGGVLAVQMPANFDQPTHTTISDVARDLEWSVDLSPHLMGSPVHTPDAYHLMLADLTSRLDIWTTTYHQVLTGEDAVAEWVSGSALRPVLNALPTEEAERFRTEYTDRVNECYPRRADGTTILPFTRLFIIAQRAS